MGMSFPDRVMDVVCEQGGKEGEEGEVEKEEEGERRSHPTFIVPISCRYDDLIRLQQATPSQHSTRLSRISTFLPSSLFPSTISPRKLLNHTSWLHISPHGSIVDVP